MKQCPIKQIALFIAIAPCISVVLSGEFENLLSHCFDFIMVLLYCKQLPRNLNLVYSQAHHARIVVSF